VAVFCDFSPGTFDLHNSCTSEPSIGLPTSHSPSQSDTCAEQLQRRQLSGASTYSFD